MIIEPVIDGVIARSAHPLGCEQSVLQQIEYASQAKPIKNGPKRVLMIGGSSGLGPRVTYCVDVRRRRGGYHFGFI